MPPFMSRGLMTQLEQLGRGLGESGRLEPKALQALAGPDWFTGWRLPVLYAVNALGSTPYWNRTLKKNGAFDRRLDRPYPAGGG